MVQRKRVSKRQQDVFKATGRVAGVRVVVSRVGDVGRFGGAYTVKEVVYESLTTTGDADRVPVTGYLIPATFTVEGLPFPLTYDVGYVNDGKRERYGVTRLDAGQVYSVSTLRQAAKAGVNVERITESALVRIALEASKVGGFAYAPGSIIDPKTHEVTGRLKIGDVMPDGLSTGVKVKHGRVVSLELRPDTRLTHRVTSVDTAEVRLLRGQRQPGRRASKPLKDADLKLIARLFDDGYNDPTVLNVPEYVRLRLIEKTKGRLAYGESWIRRQGVAARRKGYLKQGKRTKRKVKQ